MRPFGLGGSAPEDAITLTRGSRFGSGRPQLRQAQHRRIEASSSWKGGLRAPRVKMLSKVEETVRTQCELKPVRTRVRAGYI
jgi:hypothetical protein